MSCDLLTLQGLRGKWGAGVLNLVLSLSRSLILVNRSSTWHLMSKNSLRIWKKRIVGPHKDCLGLKKIAITLKLSYSMLAKTIQWLKSTGSTQNRLRCGWPKEFSAHAQRHIQRLSLENKHMSAASIAAEVEGVGSASQCSGHKTPANPAHCIILVCMAVIPEGSLF